MNVKKTIATIGLTGMIGLTLGMTPAMAADNGKGVEKGNSVSQAAQTKAKGESSKEAAQSHAPGQEKKSDQKDAKKDDQKDAKKDHGKKGHEEHGKKGHKEHGKKHKPTPTPAPAPAPTPAPPTGGGLQGMEEIPEPGTTIPVETPAETTP